MIHVSWNSKGELSDVEAVVRARDMIAAGVVGNHAGGSVRNTDFPATVGGYGKGSPNSRIQPYIGGRTSKDLQAGIVGATL